MLRSIILAFIITLTASGVSAQQSSLDNQYLINPYSLSPAYAGHNDNFEGFAGYRLSWVSIDGAPVIKMLNVNGPVSEKGGLGLSLVHESAGLFRNLMVHIGYSHTILLTPEQSLSFGISGGIFESSIDLSALNGQINNDPLLNSLDKNDLSADASAGLVYRYKKLYVGFSSQHLIESGLSDDNNFNFLRRLYQMHFRYIYDLSGDLTIEPSVVLRKMPLSPLFYEVTTLAKYRGNFWLGMNYRSGRTAGLHLGGIFFNTLAINYSYEMSFGGFGDLNSVSSQEISIGFLIGRDKNTQSSIFRAVSDQPAYYDWLDE